MQTPNSIDQYTAQRLTDAVDAQTREHSLKCLVDIHQSQPRRALDLSNYECAVRSLYDDVDAVRMASLDLISILAHLYPSHPVNSLDKKGTVKGQLHLADDAFEKVCDAVVNDGWLQVRCKAAQLLGGFTHVSIQQLLRTLSKKPVKVTSNATSAKPGGKQMSSAKGLNSTAFKTSSAGAFVHALEDEFYEVRSAALDSIWRLSDKYEDFAVDTVDFLVDMINDEIDAVRIKSFGVLASLCSKYKIELSIDQLDHFVVVLEDRDASFVGLALSILGDVIYKDAEALAAVIRILRTSLINRPADHLQVLKCLRSVGNKNAELVVTIYIDLLKIDQRFLQKEQRMDDLQFVSKLAVTLSAAQQYPQIYTTLPKYICDARPYLAVCYPDCFNLLNNTQTDSLSVETLSSSNEKLVHMVTALHAHWLLHDFPAAITACGQIKRNLGMLPVYIRALEIIVIIFSIPLPQLLFGGVSVDSIRQLSLAILQIKHLYMPNESSHRFCDFISTLCRILSLNGSMQTDIDFDDILLQLKSVVLAVPATILLSNRPVIIADILSPKRCQFTPKTPLVFPCLSALKISCVVELLVSDAFVDSNDNLSRLLQGIRIRVTLPSKKMLYFAYSPSHLLHSNSQAYHSSESPLTPLLDHVARSMPDYSRQYLLRTVLAVDFDTTVWTESACLCMDVVLAVEPNNLSPSLIVAIPRAKIRQSDDNNGHEQQNARVEVWVQPKD